MKNKGQQSGRTCFTCDGSGYLFGELAGGGLGRQTCYVCNHEKYEPTLSEHLKRIAKSKSPKKGDAARKNLERANEALRVKREKEKKE